MILYLILAFLAPALFALLLTPLVIRFATSMKAMDQPGERKIHRHPVPRWGGIAVFLSYFAGVSLLCLFNGPYNQCFVSTSGAVILSSSLLILVLGIRDDWRTLQPVTKLSVQLIAATFVYVAGIRIEVLGNPFSGGTLQLGWLSYPVTMLWIVGVTNSLNLIDGLDGLAAGTGTAIGIIVGITALARGDIFTACLAFALAGTLTGFLRYNFHPARIFLGDSGSLFVGFILALLTVISPAKSSTAFALGTSVLALGLPIMDTLLCIVRRPLRAFLSYDGQPRPLGRALKLIFQPDKDHIHHRVLSLGVPHQWSVVLLYGVSVLLGFGALMLTYAGPTAVLITAVGAGVGTFTFVRQLNYRELALLRNGLFLRLYEFPILGSRGFQATVDTLIMIVAFTAARFMAGEIIAGAPFIFALALSVCVQMGIFLFTGIYRITIRTPGIGDALKIVRVNVAAGLILVAVMALAGGGNFDSLVLSCILNFFFMITATLAMRFSYRVLAFLATDMDPNKQRVLIYGAGPSGIAALNLLLSSQAASAVPMGFLDDDPLLEGKTLHGYPIYGGHWKVAGLIRKLGISEIMVADTNIRREILRRLRVATRLTKTSLHFVSVRLDNIPAGREGRPEPAPEQAQEQEAEFAKVAVTPQQ